MEKAFDAIGPHNAVVDWFHCDAGIGSAPEFRYPLAIVRMHQGLQELAGRVRAAGDAVNAIELVGKINFTGHQVALETTDSRNALRAREVLAAPKQSFVFGLSSADIAEDRDQEPSLGRVVRTPVDLDRQLAAILTHCHALKPLD